MRVNNFSEVISVVGGKIKEVKLPHGIKKVDIIICDWMGNHLFYKCSLMKAFYARDKWLKSDGYMFPDRVTLYLAGINDAENRENTVDWWNHVYGFDMSPARPHVILQPHLSVVAPWQVTTSQTQLVEIDMYDDKRKIIEFENDFQLTCRRNDYIHGVTTYFSVEFIKVLKKSGFSTSPHNEPTHWKQSVFYFHNVLVVKKGELITGSMKITSHSKNKRELWAKIIMNFEGEMSTAHETNEYIIFG